MTTAAKLKGTNPWRKTAIEGLYEHVPSGGYYSRFRLNGKRTFRSLDTKVYTAAKLIHEKGRGEREVARQKGTTLSADFATLGELAAELERRIAANTSTDTTKENQRFSIKRLRDHWVPGAFDKTLARNVTPTFLLTLRHHLLRTANVMKGGAKEAVKGYSAGTVNQTLACLHMLFDIAVEKHVIAANPFEEKGTLQESVYLPRGGRKPQLPSRTDMDRVFAEMLKVQATEDTPEPLVKRLAVRARDVQEHARFIAYSGMRVSEANASHVADDQGDRIRVRGTKSLTSERLVPVHPLLRELLDAIKARGTDGPFLSVGTSLNALARACDRLGIPKLTHHDLRHYFATICIESGVDIPTVSAWLGHSDGGALAMEIYGHLRQEHSVAAMKRVSFAPLPTKPAAQSNDA